MRAPYLRISGCSVIFIQPQEMMISKTEMLENHQKIGMAAKLPLTLFADVCCSKRVS